MKFLYWILIAFVLSNGCDSSSSKDSEQDYENLVSLQTPGEQASQSSKVYIDSLKKISAEQEPALLIHGTFPDACTHLQEVSHYVKDDSLYLDFKAWRNPEKMCSQVLTPFTFIYEELDEEDFSSHSHFIINGTSYRY